MQNLCSKRGNSVIILKITFWSCDQLELTRVKKTVRVWKTKSLLFFLRYDPLIAFRRQNHITFISIKMMSHDLLVQMAYFHTLSCTITIQTVSVALRRLRLTCFLNALWLRASLAGFNLSCFVPRPCVLPCCAVMFSLVSLLLNWLWFRVFLFTCWI